MTDFRQIKFPKSRIATIDICDVGQQKHHVTALIEIDVTESRRKLKEYKREIGKISFTAWLIKTISVTIKEHAQVAAYLQGNRNVFIFSDINVSVAVEKELNGQKIPMPVVVEKASERSLESISIQINQAKKEALSDKDIVLQSRSTRADRFYYSLPGFARRFVWRYLLKHPKLAFSKMGNVAITSLGMMGKGNGWFIPTSVHPICFGISGIAKKPVVVNEIIEIREILNMSILLDHDVVDGAPMARFIKELCANLEKGYGLSVH